MSSSRSDDGLGRGIERLLTRARGGCKDALGELLKMFEAVLLARARLALPGDLRPKLGSSDLVQSAFAEAHRDFLTFRGSTRQQLEAWLVSILEHNAQNAVTSYRDTAKRAVGREERMGPEGSGEGPGLADRGPSPSDEAARREEEALVRQAIERMSQEDRDVLLLVQSEDLGWDEVARRLGRPSAGAARKHWLRAVERLEATVAALRRGPAGPARTPPT